MKENINISDTSLEIFYPLTDRILKFAYDINKDNHHNNHANSIITSVSNFNNIGVDNIPINIITAEMANIYAILKNQFKFQNQ